MSLAGIWRVLLRRWYITLLGLLITVGLVAGAIIKVPPTYSARATVLLIPPQTGKEVNPYLSLGGLQEVSDVLATAMSDDATSQEVIAQGGSPTWAVGRDTSTSGPIVLVTSTGSTAGSALLTVKILVDKLNPVLQQLQTQQNVPQDSFIRTITVRQDRTAELDRKGQLRSTIAAAALGLLLTVLLAAITDNRLNKRRERKAEALPEAKGHRRGEPSPRRGRDPEPVKAIETPVVAETPETPEAAEEEIPETSEPAPTEPQFAAPAQGISVAADVVPSDTSTRTIFAQPVESDSFDPQAFESPPAHFSPPAASSWQPPTSAWQPPQGFGQPHDGIQLGGIQLGSGPHKDGQLGGGPLGGGLQLPHR
jgi:hypothetical protein